MHGRAAFVYSAWTVDAIGRIRAINCNCNAPSRCWWHVTVMDQIFVEHRDFFIHGLYSTPQLILIVLSRLDKHRIRDNTLQDQILHACCINCLSQVFANLLSVLLHGRVENPVRLFRKRLWTASIFINFVLVRIPNNWRVLENRSDKLQNALERRTGSRDTTFKHFVLFILSQNICGSFVHILISLLNTESNTSCVHWCIKFTLDVHHSTWLTHMIRRFCSQRTDAFSALEVFPFTAMRYINRLFTYLLCAVSCSIQSRA